MNSSDKLRNDMKFKTDRRYIALQFLECVASAGLGYIIVLCFDPQATLRFFGGGLLAMILVYIGVYFPKYILVNDRTVSFKRFFKFEKSVRIADITEVEISFGFLNTVKITTKSGTVYKLHPRDAEALGKYLEQRISK